MCGIAGIFTHADPRTPSEQRVRQMIASIDHRGPDGTGFHVEPHLSFGFCRLAIVDLSTGDQPMTNEDGSVWLVFNGEIYNHQELRAFLQTKGHVFKSRSDSECIVHAYEHWGSDCVTHLRGIFAFAIWDRNTRALFLARDRSGVKPLYYADVGGETLFASEAKALLVDQPQLRALDLAGYCIPDALDAQQERSLFRNVHGLAPGCTLQVTSEGRKSQRYWSYLPTTAIEDDRSAETWVDAFRSVLEQSVKEQLMSDVPIGAYLSGGVDSASIVALLARMGLADVTTLTTVNRTVGQDAHFARVCVDALGLTNASFLPFEMGSDALDALPFVAWMTEGEVDAGYIARYYLAREAASRGIKVILTGQGIDEILTGYAPHFETMLGRELAARPTTSYRGMPPFRWEIGKRLAIDEQGLAEMGSEALRKMHATLSRRLLRFEDAMGMAAGTEVRVPMLDHRLLELCASIGHHKRSELLTGKTILRRAVADWLPAEVVKRPKFGFNASMLPLTRMLETSGARHERLRALLEEAALRKTDYFDAPTVQTLKAQSNYLALDHVLIVQLLDNLFVSGFDAQRFKTAPAPLPEISPTPPRALGPESVLRIHASVATVAVVHQNDATQGTLTEIGARVSFVEEEHLPLQLSADSLQVLARVDGESSCAEIVADVAGMTLPMLLEFAEKLLRLRVLDEG